MIAAVDRNGLVAAAKLASETADPKSPQELLAQALLRFTAKGLLIAATDTTTSVMTELSDAKRSPSSPVGSVCVDARRLSAAVASLPGGEVSVSLDDKLRVTLRSGKATVALAGRDGADFPTLPAVPWDEMVEVPAAPFAAAIKRAKYAGGINNPALPGPYVIAKGGKVVIVALTSHRLATSEFAAPQVKDHALVTVPLQGIDHVAEALDGSETATVAIVGDRLTIATGPGASVVVSVKLADVRAMPWEQVIPAARTKVRLWREELLAATRRAGMMAGTGEKNANAITLAITEDELTVASSLDGTGEASTAISLDAKGRPEVIALSWRYLADALGAIEGEKVDLDYGGDREPVLLRGPGSPEVHLIMVMDKGGVR